jgi:hypothetical protein
VDDARDAVMRELVGFHRRHGPAQLGSPREKQLVLAEARLARAKEALEPFVDETALGHYEWGKWIAAADDDEVEVWVTVAQMKVAAEAFATLRSLGTERSEDG